MEKQIIKTKNAPSAIGTYSQAVTVVGGKTIYLSGQIPLVPTTMTMVAQDINAQITQVFNNLSAVCLASGCDLSNIVKLNIFLIDLIDFEKVNKIMAEFFNEPYPARAVLQVSKLPKNALIEIDGIAVF